MVCTPRRVKLIITTNLLQHSTLSYNWTTFKQESKWWSYVLIAFGSSLTYIVVVTFCIVTFICGFLSEDLSRSSSNSFKMT